MSRSRILIVSEPTVAGALDTRTAALARNLLLGGCELHWAVAEGRPAPPEGGTTGPGSGFGFAGVIEVLAPTDVLRATDVLTEYTRARAIDLIYAQPPWSYLPAYIAASRLGAALVVAVLDPLQLPADDGGLPDALLKWLVLPSAARVYCGSPGIQARVLQYCAADAGRLLPAEDDAGPRGHLVSDDLVELSARVEDILKAQAGQRRPVAEESQPIVAADAPGATRRRLEEVERLYAGELAGARRLRDENEVLERRLAEAERVRSELRTWSNALSEQLNGIQQGTGWHVLQLLYRARFFLLPRGTRRERLAKWCMQKQRRLRFHLRQGPVGLVRATIGYLGRIGSSGSRQAPSNLARPVAAAMTTTGVSDFAFEIPALVSVILPVYNQAGLLRDSIESVLRQSYPNFELIIVNDGSTDEIRPVLEAYRAHPRVRMLEQANQRLPKALSNGFEFARGEFWTWTSADNLMEPQQLERQVAFLRAHREAALVYADYRAIDDRGEPLRATNFRPQNRRKPDAPDIHVPRTTQTLNTVPDNFIGACFLYRGTVGRLLGEYAPCQGVEDYDYWLRMNTLFRIQHLGTDEPLYRYRVHDNTLNARAAEHHISQRLARLMAYDVDRRWYYQRLPFTIFVDPPTEAWLARLNLSGHAVQSLPADDTWANTVGKVLLLVRADTLPRLRDRPLPAECCVAAWLGEDAFEPYRCRAELRQYVDVCFASSSATLERLALFTRDVFAADPGQGLFDLAVAFANNRLFCRKTLPREDCERTLPRMYPPRAGRLKVLIQVDHFLHGGLEQVVLDVLQTLDRDRFEAHLLILLNEGAAAEQARRLDIKVLRLQPKEDRVAAYRQLLVEQSYDVINAHYSTFGAAIAHELRIPFVQTVHNAYIWFSAADIEAYRAADAYTTAYLCVSNLVAAYADLRLGLPVRKMLVVPNGVNTEALDVARAQVDRAALRAAHGFVSDDFVLLCTASIVEVKAHRPLVAALAQARRQQPRLKLALLGRSLDDERSTQYAQAVAEDITRLGLPEAVRFLGYHDDPHKFYFMADAFVLPSFCEGWSLALAEALYAGLPTVASDVGSAHDLLGQTGGQLLPLPFGSIVSVADPEICTRPRAEQLEYTVQIAEALVRVAADPLPPVLTPTLKASLDRRVAYQAYADVFEWVAAGGDPAAARPWVWDLHETRRARQRHTTVHPQAVTADPERPRRSARPGFTPGPRSIDEVCARARDARSVVVFPLSIAWSNWLFQRPHHLARHLARAGYLAVYDDSNTFTGFTGLREIEENLLLLRGSEALLHQLPDPILWTYCYNYHHRDAYPGTPRTIYDLVDDFDVHPYDKQLMQRNHARAVSEATAVAYVARALEALTGGRADRLYLPNGVDCAHFAEENRPPLTDRTMLRVVAEHKPIVGYYGALAEWFDCQLLEETARARPDWNFVLIGPNYDGSLSRKPVWSRPNVRWLGPRDYAELPAFLHSFDVAMIPFVINPITLATSPLKLYEFFAAGKPVIATPLPECQGFSQVHSVRDAEQFSAALDEALAQSRGAEFRESLRAIARRNSWDERVRVVSAGLEAARRRPQVAAATQA